MANRIASFAFWGYLFCASSNFPLKAQDNGLVERVVAGRVVLPDGTSAPAGVESGIRMIPPGNVC